MPKDDMDLRRSVLLDNFNTEIPYPIHAFTKPTLGTAELMLEVQDRRNQRLCTICGTEYFFHITERGIELYDMIDHPNRVNPGEDVCNECTSAMISGGVESRRNNNWNEVAWEFKQRFKQYQ